VTTCQNVFMVQRLVGYFRIILLIAHTVTWGYAR